MNQTQLLRRVLDQFQYDEATGIVKVCVENADGYVEQHQVTEGLAELLEEIRELLND